MELTVETVIEVAKRAISKYGAASGSYLEGALVQAALGSLRPHVEAAIIDMTEIVEAKAHDEAEEQRGA